MGLTIGVDVGGTKVLAGVVDENGQILEQDRQSTPKTDGEAIAEVIAGLVASLRSRHEVDAVGIGAAGWIDLDRANVMFAPNLVWRNEPLKLRVSKLIDLPIVVENDANCHAWAEHRFGAARGRDTVVAVILGTGIGGGIILEGRLYRGGFGIAGEPGHRRDHLHRLRGRSRPGPGGRILPRQQPHTPGLCPPLHPGGDVAAAAAAVDAVCLPRVGAALCVP